jgi:transposase
MTATPTIASAPVVHALLKSHGKRGMTQSEVARRLCVSRNTAGKTLRMLVASGEVIATTPGVIRYIDKSAMVQPEAQIAGVFTWDRWTKPLKGYNLFAHADLAMATRSV